MQKSTGPIHFVSLLKHLYIFLDKLSYAIR